MKDNKKIKFSFLIIAMVSLTIVLSIIPAALTLISQSRGVMTSYMHDDKKLIEDDFYKSKTFDESLIRPLAFWLNNAVLDENNTDGFDVEYAKHQKSLAKEQLSYLKNIRYMTINNNTNEIYTNTESKTPEEFISNVKGDCDIEISSNEYQISYKKILNNKTFEKTSVNQNIGDLISLEDVSIYISIPKNLLMSGNYYDKIADAKDCFERDTLYFKAILTLSVVSIIVFLISIFIYKKMKYVVLDKDSMFLKLYKIIPLEFYLFLLFLDAIFIRGVMWGYYDFLEILFVSFIGIFSFFVIVYILIKQYKSLDNKRNILKSSIILNIVFLLKKICKKIIVSVKNIPFKEFPLIKRILLLSIICMVINGFGWMMSVRSWYNCFLFGFGLSVVTLVGFTYYIIRKLSYLNYIIDGSKRIKEGDINYKLMLVGNDNFTCLAENINNIGDGLDNAIGKQLKSERMKSELITNVSHDLKTPLTSIINYVELIKKDEDVLQPEHIKDYVNILDKKSKRLKILIEDLFEASRASSGNLELNIQKIELRQLLRQSIGEMEEKLSTLGLDIKLNMPEDKVYINADGRRLYRVLENLLSNISKYSLSNTRVYIDLSINNRDIILTMKNISSYELNFDPNEIMERFKRGDESRNTEGSGLGLAIARDLVNIQGGKFDVDIDGDLFKVKLEFQLIEN